jgi:hypothetical protein
MKHTVVILIATALVTFLGSASACAQSFTEVAGKWSLTKKTSWGDVTQKLELKDDKFSYRETDEDGAALLVARGNVKVERLGPFKVLRLTGIEGGYSDGALEPTYDDRVILYVKGWNTLTLALNFDAYRDGEEAKADVYKKSSE